MDSSETNRDYYDTEIVVIEESSESEDSRN